MTVRLLGVPGCGNDRNVHPEDADSADHNSEIGRLEQDDLRRERAMLGSRGQCAVAGAFLLDDGKETKSL